MELLLSAILGDLTSRSINFIINKVSDSKPPALAVNDSLQRVLLRAQVIIDEAMGKHITNQAMLLRLNMLRDAVHRGHYVLDTFRYQHQDEEDAKDQAMEVELVINFLLRPQSHGAEELEFMPIIGPCQVGKSTLVTHVCKDERVRGHFSKNIVFFRIHGFTDDELAIFREGCTVKLQNHTSDMKKDGRLLVIIELDGDLNEEALDRLHFASKQYAPRGSKLIVTSRFDNIVKFGSTQALTLKYLSNEAYWYFFKTLTFGSMDPEMHPRLMHFAMEIARMQKCSFVGANIVSRLLRDNFDAQFWLKVLAFLKGLTQERVSRFEHPFDLLRQNRPTHLGRMATPSEDVVVYHQHQCYSEEEVPKLRLQDVLYGSIKPHGNFKVLVWKSLIPPYSSYVYSCEIRELKTTTAKRKRPTESGITLC
ncbi:putative disease resistance protein RGA3 [Panicum hallii]|uniref:putative disease resistance protein RGA3 n=1 Tax=Panicum hallii TaxID=206008 RepID=UPI000DF4D9D2|nr:putative disease resistance protein RGA3 [Panicum hallii]